ncbi:hypothetical protein ACCO45_006869 [Purpureocillium lilacinum]|uniref:Uncharacterized protein n=1 Tax=Purpureocillium lilacinum TaxID=33203 RepID=A0ACC4DRJ3_PURLI
MLPQLSQRRAQVCTAPEATDRPSYRLRQAQAHTPDVAGGSLHRNPTPPAAPGGPEPRLHRFSPLVPLQIAPSHPETPSINGPSPTTSSALDMCCAVSLSHGAAQATIFRCAEYPSPVVRRSRPFRPSVRVRRNDWICNGGSNDTVRPIMQPWPLQLSTIVPRRERAWRSNM